MKKVSLNQIYADLLSHEANSLDNYPEIWHSYDLIEALNILDKVREDLQLLSEDLSENEMLEEVDILTLSEMIQKHYSIGNNPFIDITLEEWGAIR